MADNQEKYLDAHAYTGKYQWTPRDLDTSIRYRIRITGPGMYSPQVSDSGPFSLEPEPGFPYPGAYDVTIPILLPESGYTAYTGSYYILPHNGDWPRIGDRSDGIAFRGHMAFDISGIPRHAQIATAVLHIYNYYRIMNQPFETLVPFNIYWIHCEHPPCRPAHLLSSRNGPPNHPIAVTESVRWTREMGLDLWRVQLQFENLTDNNDHDDYIEFYGGCFLRITYVIEY
jgi:hypothetical protein